MKWFRDTGPRDICARKSRLKRKSTKINDSTYPDVNKSWPNSLWTRVVNTVQDVVYRLRAGRRRHYDLITLKEQRNVVDLILPPMEGCGSVLRQHDPILPSIEGCSSALHQQNPILPPMEGCGSVMRQQDSILPPMEGCGNILRYQDQIVPPIEGCGSPQRHKANADTGSVKFDNSYTYSDSSECHTLDTNIGRASGVSYIHSGVKYLSVNSAKVKPHNLCQYTDNRRVSDPCNNNYSNLNNGDSCNSSIEPRIQDFGKKKKNKRYKQKRTKNLAYNNTGYAVSSINSHTICNNECTPVHTGNKRNKNYRFRKFTKQSYKRNDSNYNSMTKNQPNYLHSVGQTGHYNSNDIYNNINCNSNSNEQVKLFTSRKYRYRGRAATREHNTRQTDSISPFKLDHLKSSINGIPNRGHSQTRTRSRSNCFRSRSRSGSFRADLNTNRLSNRRFDINTKPKIISRNTSKMILMIHSSTLRMNKNFKYGYINNNSKNSNNNNNNDNNNSNRSSDHNKNKNFTTTSTGTNKNNINNNQNEFFCTIDHYIGKTEKSNSSILRTGITSNFCQNNNQDRTSSNRNHYNRNNNLTINVEANNYIMKYKNRTNTEKAFDNNRRFTIKERIMWNCAIATKRDGNSNKTNITIANKINNRNNNNCIVARLPLTKHKLTNSGCSHTEGSRNADDKSNHPFIFNSNTGCSNIAYDNNVFSNALGTCNNKHFGMLSNNTSDGIFDHNNNACNICSLVARNNNYNNPYDHNINNNNYNNNCKSTNNGGGYYSYSSISDSNNNSSSNSSNSNSSQPRVWPLSYCDALYREGLLQLSDPSSGRPVLSIAHGFYNSELEAWSSRAADERRYKESLSDMVPAQVSRYQRLFLPQHTLEPLVDGLPESVWLAWLEDCLPYLATLHACRHRKSNLSRKKATMSVTDCCFASQGDCLHPPFLPLALRGPFGQHARRRFAGPLLDLAPAPLRHTRRPRRLLPYPRPGHLRGPA